ncbi:hypothetical protein OSB04_012466 [Centaurea solstitialis]|uniref:Protein MULTIPOLAR SPINDLE 1 n=1 Tax=Centaurea solstitialis TaxID=347529 RepID=A0AA38WEL9_9ASTR|nr:hypothetical protein OSB04_012466 [Centaurea solstitialis]
MASDTIAGSEERLRIAIAMALLRSKLLDKPSDAPSASDALKWKRKAKERKQEILRLKHDLQQVEDGLHHELFPGNTSCKCYFFENMGKFSPNQISREGFDWRLSDVLRRRFLRQVRLKERRKQRNEGSKQRLFLHECIAEETEQLRASVDFLVELCDTMSSPDDTNFANWSHQAVDFILDAIKNMLSKGKITEPVEGIVSSLSLRLVRKMCTTLQGNDSHQVRNDAQFHVQHLLRKLGSESYIGQRVILAVSQRISLLAENLLFLDPFEPTFLEMHSSLYDPAYGIFGIRPPNKLVNFRWICNRVGEFNGAWSKRSGSVGKQVRGVRIIYGSCNWVGCESSESGCISPNHNLNPNILQPLADSI